MNTEWRTFGHRNDFAFEYRFQPDPDAGKAATALESGSWGAFRFWVKGRNLCQHHHKGEMGHEISWYLSPLLNWLSENWNPLFHEECFPLPCDKRNARIGYMDSLRRYMGDTDPVVEARGEAWFGWWQRHALRSCRRGGLFPDLFFRRMVDFSEISWGNFPVEFAGHSVTPTILLNTAHPKNLQDEGRRFSIGHELCHILHDRFFGSEVAIASGPWAPANIEKRANAFSAMLLMPLDLINPLIRSLPCPLDTLDGIHSLAKQLRVGRRALVWHLYNLSKLDEAQRLNLEQTMRASEEGLQRHE
ncbi:MAG: ImmA/IrrE family metallo-endopeptidase [Magnetococcales bacterium]|nr:ImmA/IrrE family metallo-endopeptidase [Magnetococcales bacterium]